MVNYKQKENYRVEDLVGIMAILRGEGGCPWDREQTHESIRQNMLEEAYEAAEAIDLGNTDMLKEELGDVLLQVVFHAQMEREAGSFTLNDVADGICKKLILRHPHIFGDVQVANSAEVLVTWDAIKKQEKSQKTTTDTLTAVARSLPALIRAEKVQKKAGKAGFPVEYTDAENKIGEKLFALVREAREIGVDPERALEIAIDAYIKNINKLEEMKKV
ncbi:MAG: MazG family protein [Clostridiaceae bacterium]|nr:MazG family protein [Clostridiaceae bacterium]